ncbi:MAG: Spy/CpxP family protein refolding chaperone [Roseococcus sp.]
MSPFRMATLGLGLMLPLAAVAQTSPPAAANPAAASGAARRERASMTPEQRAQRVEAHLTQLRAQLVITPSQAAAWDAFAKVSRDNATELHDRFQQRETQFARISAVENMADYATIAELHATQLRRLATAFQTLYAALSPEQQQSADTAFRTRRTPGAAPG